MRRCGCSATAEGETTRAEELHREALAINRRLGSALETAISLCNLGRLRHADGDGTVARPMYQEALRLLLSIGSRGEVLRCLECLLALEASPGAPVDVEESRGRL